MTDCEINPLVWFGNRELANTPKHFVSARTAITPESKIWILNKLSGRFSCTTRIDETEGFYVSELLTFPAFEDPAEATLYELYWS